MGCVVHSETDIPLHFPNRNDRHYLLKYGKFRNISSFPKAIYKPSLGKTTLVKPKKCIRVDLLGYKDKLTKNFVIEISHTSDIAQEARKLKKLNWIETKIIVRTDRMEGKLNGIPIIPYEKFRKWFTENFLKNP